METFLLFVISSLLILSTHSFHLRNIRDLEKRSDTKKQAIDDFRGDKFNKTIPWQKEKVTYAVLQESNVLSPKVVRKMLREAFDTWSKQIPREFVEVQDNKSPDIKIEFVTENHGDTQPFLKNQIIYAHADTSGVLHFNDDTFWKAYESGDKIEPAAVDFYSVALHELGHVLGLEHNMNVSNSIMRKDYKNSVDSRGFYVRPRLDLVDIKDIKNIYGERTDRQSRADSNNTVAACSEYKENTDIIGNNLIKKPGQPQHCCSFCRATKECEAFVWNDHDGGTCYLKRGSKITRKKDEFFMGTI